MLVGACYSNISINGNSLTSININYIINWERTNGIFSSVKLYKNNKHIFVKKKNKIKFFSKLMTFM